MTREIKSKMVAISYEAIQEAERALNKYQRPYASEHEFYAVFKEESEELWDEIKKKEELRDMAAMRKEAIQCMAVLLRFINQMP